jgi:hypothetical protein
MMPGFLHRRDLLHKNQLAKFREWCGKRGFIIHETPKKAEYEVLRLEEYTPSGNNPHMVFYQRGKSDHVTIPKEALLLVQAFIAQRKEYGK